MGKIMKTILFTLLLALNFSANAGTITTNLITTNLGAAEVAADDKVLVEINASGFDAVDIFSFNFLFDTDIFQLDMSSITSDLNLVNTAMGMIDGLEIVKEDFGLYFSFSDFTSSPKNFNIAKFNLIAKAPGRSQFAIAEASGFSTFDNTINPTYTTTFSSGRSIAVAASVSEPSSIALFLLSVTGLLWLNRKKPNH